MWGKYLKYGCQPERLTCVFICFLVQFGDDVFIPTDEPHGSIEARLSRKPILISNLWNATKKPVAGLRPAQLLQIPSLSWFSVSICYSSPAAGICLHIYCVTSFELLLVLYVIEDSSITPPSLFCRVPYTKGCLLVISWISDLGFNNLFPSSLHKILVDYLFMVNFSLSTSYQNRRL
jgi:hypothetical protein